MLSQILDQEIQRFCARVRQDNPLFVNAAAGKLTPVHVRRYVAGLHQLVLHTPVNLRLAVEASAKRQQPELERHFQQKYAEECDHHEWANEDIGKIDEAYATAGQSERSPAIDNIVAYNQAAIQQDPRLYMVYILLVEYATVLGGPVIIDLLQSRCGIPSDMLSIVGNHVVLDQQHVREGLAEIDRLIPVEWGAACVASLRQAMALLEGFFAEVGRVH